MVDDARPMLWGGELLLRDGVPAGQVTSAAWGATVGACVGLGYVRADGPVTQAWLDDAVFEVDVAGERYVVHATPEGAAAPDFAVDEQRNTPVPSGS